MKITVDRKSLIQAMKDVKGVMRNFGTMPVLSMAVLKASSNGVKLTATDLEIRIVRDVVGDTHESGSCLIPPARLIKGLSKIKSAFIDISSAVPDESEGLKVEQSRHLSRLLNSVNDEYDNRVYLSIDSEGRALFRVCAWVFFYPQPDYLNEDEIWPGLTESEIERMSKPDVFKEDYRDPNTNPTITFKAGTFELKIKSPPVDEYPPIPDITGARAMPGFNVSKLAQVYSATSDDESRHLLNCACLSDSELVATDGHRCYRVAYPEMRSFIGTDKDILIPRALIGQLLRLSKQMPSPSFVVYPDVNGISTAKIGFKSDNITLFCDVPQGEFPDYRRVSDHHAWPVIERQVAVNADELIKHCEQIAAFGQWGIKWTINGTHSTIESCDPELGTVTEQIEVLPMNPFAASDEDYTIGLNVNYVLDMARTFGGELLLTFRDPASSVLIDTQDGDRAVIMPARL